VQLSSTPINTTPARNYLNFSVLVIGLLAFIAAYWPTLQLLMSSWNGEEAAGNNHGWLVLGSAVYLLYAKREQLKQLRARGSVWLLGMLLGAGLLWFVAAVAQVQLVQFLMLPVLVLGLIGVQYGRVGLLKTALPIGLLFFALPIWDPLLPLLQDITTAVAHFNLQLTGRPVYVEGHYVHVSGGTFLIEDACSGLRFLLVSTILSLMNSELNQHTKKQTIGMLLLAIGLAFLANTVRVFVVIVIGDVTKMQHPWVADHGNLGWGIYLVVVMLPFFWVNRYVYGKAAVANNEASAVLLQSQARRILLGGMAMVAVILAPLSYRWLSSKPTATAVEQFAPTQFPNWQTVTSNPNSREWLPAYAKYSARNSVAYQASSAGAVVQLVVVSYADQVNGAELINVNNTLADEQTWSVAPGSESMAVVSFHDVEKSAKQAILQGPQNQRLLVWYWYNIGGHYADNAYKAKLFQLLAFVQGRRDASLLAVAVPCEGQCEESKTTLAQFAQTMPSNFPR
jgi:exosortase A